MAGRHSSGRRGPLIYMRRLPASCPLACSICKLRFGTRQVPGLVFLALQAEGRERSGAQAGKTGCATSTRRDEAQIFTHVGGVWEHGDGVQGGGCDRRVRKAWTKRGGLYKVGQGRLRGERGTIPPAHSCHQEEGLLQVMLRHEQTREALPRNIVKEEREESKALCTAQSMEGETIRTCLIPQSL